MVLYIFFILFFDSLVEILRIIRVVKMTMLCWMCDKTGQDRIRNDNIRERVGVAPIVKKMVETRLRWFWYVERRLVDFVISSIDPIGSSQITGGRRRSRKTIRETI